LLWVWRLKAAKNKLINKKESLQEHYRRLLLLPKPWEVTKVNEDIAGESVKVWLRWPDGVKFYMPGVWGGDDHI